MKKFATITVIGRDKTGVVARVTSFLFEQRANIEALEEQVTRGQFSMTVQSSWREPELDRQSVSGGLDKPAQRPRPVDRVEAGHRQPLPCGRRDREHEPAASQPPAIAGESEPGAWA